MKRADTFLLYGATDTGKTAQLGEIAKWHFARTGEISRLISADSGWDPLEPLVITPSNTDGIIEGWNVQGLQNPWVIMVELSEGAWPTITDAGKLRMSRPVWRDGKLVASDGKHIVGQVFLEGLNTLATVGMQDHINTGRKLAQDVVTPFQSVVAEVDASGKESQRSLLLASAAPAHYGQVQRFLLDDLVPRFGKLAVDRVVWTAHEARGADDITGIQNSVLGPATVGKAYVDKTTQKFGHSFHLTVETTPSKDARGGVSVLREFRAWFVSHPDDVLTKMKWPAKVSLPIERSVELLRKYPGGFIPLGSLTSFLEFLEPPSKPAMAGMAKP